MVRSLVAATVTLLLLYTPLARPQSPTPPAIVLHAAHLLEIDTGKILTPGEVLIQGGRIIEAGTSVRHPAGAEVITFDNQTLLPGPIDAHVHLFLHPGAEDLQTSSNPLNDITILEKVSFVMKNGVIDKSSSYAKPCPMSRC